MIATRPPDAKTELPQATVQETLSIMSDMVIPTIAKGVIIRRPLVVSTAERLELDRRAVRRVQKLRNKYGEGPLMLQIPLPGRSQALILAPQHVHQVLDNSPEPFATASSEKRAALSHFQPKGALISHGPERTDRRRYNEEVLDHTRNVHRLGEAFVEVVNEEAGYLLREIRRQGELDWETFSDTWFTIVRRVIFGDVARNDHELSHLMAELRSDGNWAFLKPKRTHLRARLFERLNRHLAKAAPGSLASIMAHTRITKNTAPNQQVPQWLFAFDPAGMTTFRSLALLATHPEQAEHAQAEVRRAGDTELFLPYLRACVLESLRLWPTSPMVLRQSTTETVWETGIMPENTGIMIYTPFFHRDDQRLWYADTFVPDLWLDGRQPQSWPLIPFSSGPAMCPGRNLVLLLASNMLAALLERHQVRLKRPERLNPRGPLPGTLNHFSLRFEFRR